MQNLGAIVALASLCMTLLGALVAVTIKFATVATTLASLVAQLQEGLKEIKQRLVSLDDMPVMKRDIRQLEDTVGRLVSAFPKAVAELAEHRGRLASLHDEDIKR